MLKMSKAMLRTILAIGLILALTVSAMASPGEFPAPTFENGTSASTKVITIPGNQKTGGGKIEFDKGKPAKPTRADNIPPVAGLQYLIMNPDSLINGQITTNTQIAWLWSYNGQNFTYDPDGDAITNINIGGIPANSIIGSITGNIGYATQFSVSGQYVMTFQVQDARGALSNMLKIIINVEPADGNTRPTCAVTYNFTGAALRQERPLVISWAQSSDADAGDSIADVKGLVYKDGSTEAVDIQKYLITLKPSALAVKMSATGRYEIWISVADTKGAWSDWAAFTVDVKSNTTKFSNMSLNTYIDNDIPEDYDAWWLDYEQSINLVWNSSPSPDPEWVLDQVKFKHYPNGVPHDRLWQDIKLTGRLTYLDGEAASNELVTISLPMTRGDEIRDTFYTDANGNFTYTLLSSNYWEKLGYRTGTNCTGDFTGKYTPYAHYSPYGMLFSYNTRFTASSGNAVWGKDVAATAGVTTVRIVGAGYQCSNNGVWVDVDYRF